MTIGSPQNYQIPCLIGSNQEDWNVRCTHYLVGDASKEQPFQPAAAVRRHDDKVYLSLIRAAKNPDRSGPFSLHHCVNLEAILRAASLDLVEVLL
jgi:hypothetical protein